MVEPLLKIGEVRERLGIAKEDEASFNKQVEGWRKSCLIRSPKADRYYRYYLSDIQKLMSGEPGIAEEKEPKVIQAYPELIEVYQPKLEGIYQKPKRKRNRKKK